MKYALLGGAVTAFFLLIALLTDTQQFGRSLHVLLFLVGIYIAVVQTPLLTADLFSVERRHRTLGLLFLAGLRPSEIFLSKVLGGAMLAFANLLALVPFLAVPFLSGGLSFSLFFATAACLPVLLLFTLSLTLLASVLCDEESSTMVLAAVVGLVVTGLTPALYLAGCSFSASGPISADWLLVSPAYGPYMILNDFTVGSPADFWRNTALTLGWSGLALGLAGAMLKRTWQRGPDTVPASWWRGRMGAWLRGTPQWRRGLARRWLEVHPFTWLAMHDRSAERLAWVVVSCMAALWLAGMCAWPGRWPSVPNLLITATLMNGAVEWLALYSAGKRIGEDRRSGALELLLTTPLSVSQIVEGQWEALRQQFQPVFWATLAFNMTMMVVGFFVRSWNWRSVCAYVLVWTPFLLWSWRRSFRSTLTTLWVSLNCARPAYAVWRTTGGASRYGWIAWTYLFCSFWIRHFSFRDFPSGSVGELVFAVFFLVFALAWVREKRGQRNALEERLFADFRSIAQEAIPEPSDPRFKQWKIENRFPMIWPPDVRLRIRPGQFPVRQRRSRAESQDA